MVAAFLVFLSAQIQTCALSNYRSACLLPTLSVYYYPQTFFNPNSFTIFKGLSQFIICGKLEFH